MNTSQLLAPINIKENALSEILSPDEIKSLSNFLGSLDPRLSYSDKRRNKVVSHLNGGVTMKSDNLFGQFSNPEDKPNYEKAGRIIQSLTGISVSNTIHLAYGAKLTRRPRDLYSGEKMPYYIDEWVFSTDSNVYLLEGEKYIMKLYVTFGKNEIISYHKFQNRLAGKEYDVNHSGEIDGQFFHSVHVNILKLPENGVIGTEYASAAFIPYIQGKTLNIEAEEKSNLQDIDKSIMSIIWKENNLKSKVPGNSRMNFKFNEIKDGVLYVTLTDIGSSIRAILEQEKLFDYLEQKTPKLKEVIRAKYQQIINRLTLK